MKKYLLPVCLFLLSSPLFAQKTATAKKPKTSNTQQKTDQRAGNPILPGFHADPSILRVGEDYYIAVSTFEWYPGVQIYHSRDLANWTLAKRPLDRKSLLDMRGDP